MYRKIGITVAAILTFLLTIPALAASEPITVTGNKRSTYDGFDYELWSQRSSDSISMTLTGGGNFKCDWDGENILFRTGKKLGSAKTYEEYGSITIDYEAEHNITRGDVSYLCVYGWTEDPMIEFYVVENYGKYKPPGGKGYKGTIEVDGGTYEVYVSTRVEQPSIKGTKTFEQYFSVRVDKRTEGTITVSDHFKAWEEMGLDMSGKIYEVSLCVEGYNSSGNANIYSHMLTVGDTSIGFASEPEPPVSSDVSDSSVNEDISVEANEIDDNKDEKANDGNLLMIILIIIPAVIIAAVILFFVQKRRSNI